MNKITVGIFLILTTSVFCEDTYLIYRNDNFPQDRFWSAGTLANPIYTYFQDCGKYEKNYDGKYARLILPKKDSKIDALENKMFIKKISIRNSVKIMNYERIGEAREVIITKELNPMPTDYFEIVKSTGVE